MLSGTLKFGVIPSVAPYVLPHLLPVLQERHPDLELELRETQTRFLVEELIRGALDVVMIALPAPQADIETLPLFDDAFLLAAPAADDLPSRTRITADDIDPTPADPARRGPLPARPGARLLQRCRRRHAARTRRDQSHHRDADGGERLWRDADSRKSRCRWKRVTNA